MKKILITGASSYVGARLYNDLKKDFAVTGTYNTNKLFEEFLRMDITDYNGIYKTINSVSPDVILHVVGNPNARWCEANPKEAVKINEDGTRNVVNAANQTGAKVIYMSSVAAINPVNIYGETKLAGETFAKDAKAGYIILRPSLIIGLSPNTSNDRPFNRLLRNIDEKTPAVYDTSWKFQPTWIGHISEIVGTLIKTDTFYETISITVPELKSRYDLAKDILSHFNIPVTPKNDNDKTPVIIVDQKKLEELSLPQYNYQDIIEKIVKEIEGGFLRS
ncbi:MAG: sugar nucleotide-binding protein [Candidatus Aenigmarchaeota archaeon]|nr:sugar nucleotide-binding protein [Candidatus Aenigmarchaeota archaeon]